MDLKNKNTMIALQITIPLCINYIHLYCYTFNGNCMFYIILNKYK